MYAIEMTTRTKAAAKYLQQLCKHFSHRMDITFDEKTAEAIFSFGYCRMDAKERELKIHFQAEEAGLLLQAKSVIEEHLLRFAYKENLKFNWSDAVPLDR